MIDYFGLPLPGPPCQFCGLDRASSLHHPYIPFSGTSKPTMLIIGEGPGFEEDLRYEFFIGKAGGVLRRCLQLAGIPIDQVAFENAVRCRPPGNRTPTSLEIKCCGKYLMRSIAALNPKVLVTVGDPARFALTGKSGGITKMHGMELRWKPPIRFEHTATEFSLFPLFHPSYVGYQGGWDAPEETVAGVEFIKDLKKAWTVATGGEKTSLRRIVVNSDDALDAMDAKLRGLLDSGRAKYLACDTETENTYPYPTRRELVMVSLCAEPDEGFSIPVAHPESFFRDRLRISRLQAVLRGLLLSYPVVGHNFGFDQLWLLSKLGILIPNLHMDTMLAHQLLYAGSLPNGLDFMAAKYCDMIDHKVEIRAFLAKLDAERKALGRKLKQKQPKPTMKDVPLGVITKYAADDAIATYRLVPIMERLLTESGQTEAYDLLYRKTQESVAMLSFNGLKIDVPFYKHMYQIYPSLLEEAFRPIKESSFFQRFRERMGKDFSPASPPQRIEFIYNVLGLPMVSKKRSVDKGHRELLQEHCKAHGLEEHLKMVQSLGAWINQQWLWTNHCKNMPWMLEPRSKPTSAFWGHLAVQPATYTVHPTYKLLTKTGRSSAEKPPLHGIPWKSVVKRMYCSRWADIGGILLEADYAQMELRVFANKSKDPDFTRALVEGRDLHVFVAARIYKIEEKDVQDWQRRHAKTVNFGLLYGRTPESIAVDNECSVEEARKLVEDYFTAFPGVKAWIDQQHDRALTEKVIWTNFKRRRFLDVNRFGGGKGAIGKVERRSINTPIQSEASDLTFLAMNAIYWRIKEAGLKSLLIGFIHDSVLVDIYPGELATLYQIIYEEMNLNLSKRHPWFQVPVEVEFELGASWGELLEIVRKDNGFQIVGKEEEFRKFFPRLKAQLLRRDLTGIQTLQVKEKPDGSKKFSVGVQLCAVA